MDEQQALDALTKVLEELAENPHDITLYGQHIRLSRLVEGMEQPALEAMVECVAAPEEAWLALIKAKETTIDLNTASGVNELLELYEKAEADYLSIPILHRHLQFLIDRCSYYGEEMRPAELEDTFSTSWTREAIGVLVNKGIGHLKQSHILWDVQRDWELEVLEATPSAESAPLVELVELLLLTRLHQPHSNSEDTFQSYSSFTTNYKSPQDYETLMVTASKIRTQSAKSFERREPLEIALEHSNFSLETYARYIAAERRARNPDLFVMNTIFERAIAEAARRTFNGEDGAEKALRAFWTGYCDALRLNNAGAEVELSILQRATRSVPNSGEIWARYIRYLERVEYATNAPGSDITISDVYNTAFNHKPVQKDVDQVVPIVLARAAYERRRLEVNFEDDDTLPTLIAILETGIDLIQSLPSGDPKLRLEKYLADVYLNMAQQPEQAINVWKTATKHLRTSYMAWISYTDLLIKLERFEQARKVFIEIHTKNIDWPEAIWEAWIVFEHMHGSVEDVDTCFDKIEKAEYQVNARRAKEAERAMQIAMEAQAAYVPVTSIPPPDTGPSDTLMDIDAPPRGQKRGAEEDSPTPDANKKAKMEQKPAPLKRDRENCTVFVAELPTGITAEELKDLFKDCGKVRDVKITELPNALVATVEFFERDSIPPALTKDKKRVREHEVAVHLAWKSTIYVTNFPESADDAFMRDLFGKYGIIFDVRWPSKKFKNTRRFCYVQYTSPTSAQDALELHGRELEPNQPMNVFISNPERKKERTDQDANEREIYVAGLSKFTTQVDLEKLFKTYGAIKEVRMALDKDDKSKGFAFVEFEEEKDALVALEANNHELKKRRIAVTLADSRVRARNKNIASEAGLSRVADARNRSVRIRGLPPATQEGLLQQTLEKVASVKRVEVFVEQREAVAELENAAEAGKLLLRTEPIVFNGATLKLSEEGSFKRQGASSSKTGSLFVPRAAVSKPRAGLGHSRRTAPKASGAQEVATSESKSPVLKSTGRGQDDFRKMLGGQ